MNIVHPELPPFVCDNIHFNAQEIDSYGYHSIWNFIVCEREAGKSVLMWKKIYNAFRNEGRPSIVFRRLICDITEQYIEDTITLIEKFTGKRPDVKYSKNDIKNGQMDVKIGDKLFFRIIGLSAPMSRLKSMVIRGVKYMMMDEFICNLRIGEKYLSDEPFRVQELYTTYNRETVDLYPGKPIKIYMFGNPYSLFNPYFSAKNVNTNLLYPGALVVGPDYVIHCYQICKELKDKILANNPMYQFDETYKKYAFDGRAIHDTAIRIIDVQPKGFRLVYTMKLHNKILGIYRGYSEELDLHYWCKILDPSTIAEWRNLLCFDFGQMASRCVLVNPSDKKKYWYLKESIEHRWIAYKDIEASYFMEEVYNEI